MALARNIHNKLRGTTVVCKVTVFLHDGTVHELTDGEFKITLDGVTPLHPFDPKVPYQVARTSWGVSIEGECLTHRIIDTNSLKKRRRKIRNSKKKNRRGKR